MQPAQTNPQRRYGCHECREDAELVMSDRATSVSRDLYHLHLRQCRECRRMHRLLYALYEGPVIPAAPTGIREEKEFHAALRRAHEETPEPWYHKLSIRAGVTALAASAAVLALALFDVTPGVADLSSQADSTTADASKAIEDAGEAAGSLAAKGGIDHPAQTYGRVVGGDAMVIHPEGEAANTDTFPVGTHFSVPANETLQVGVMGKIVANFTPGTEVEWTTASRNLIELTVERGIAAVRYDRRPSDPILQVRTPSAVVRVIGTVFTVEVGADDNTAVSVLRGQVEVLRPSDNGLLAEVESGNVYDVQQKFFFDVGKVEVAAALPLSNEVEDGELADPMEGEGLADGRIPASWHVPGLPDDPARRSLLYVPDKIGTGQTIEVAKSTHRVPRTAAIDFEVRPPTTRRGRVAPVEGEDLLESLAADVEATRRKELKAALSNCRNLFNSHSKRYRAAKCLTDFLSQYGDDPAAVEGYLLVGMLRHDYAFDYRAAEKSFEAFLRRAPSHPSAELAHYRLWLSATEDGRISTALERGRKYLSKYENGRYVGKILQRFPELKSEI